MDARFRRFEPVVPSDTAPPASFPVQGLLVVGTGDLALMDAAGTVTTIVAVPAFTVIPLAAVRVMATGTTATPILGMGD